MFIYDCPAHTGQRIAPPKRSLAVSCTGAVFWFHFSGTQFLETHFLGAHFLGTFFVPTALVQAFLVRTFVEYVLSWARTFQVPTSQVPPKLGVHFFST